MKVALEFRSPMITVETARAALGCNEDIAVEYIESGKLAWAWDIGIGSRRRLREIRVLASSLRDLQAGEPPYEGPEETVLAEVIGSLTRPRLSYAEVRSRILCSQQHVCRLADAGEISGFKYNRAWWCDRASFEAFLRKRRIR